MFEYLKFYSNLDKIVILDKENADRGRRLYEYMEIRKFEHVQVCNKECLTIKIEILYIYCLTNKLFTLLTIKWYKIVLAVSLTTVFLLLWSLHNNITHFLKFISHSELYFNEI